MRRREFIALLGGAGAIWPLTAHTQEAGRIYRLGDLHLSPPNAPWNVALFDALKRDGFIEGQNLIVDNQGFGLRVEQLAEHASAIVKAHVDVIICGGDFSRSCRTTSNKRNPNSWRRRRYGGIALYRFACQAWREYDWRQHPFQRT